MTIDTKQLRALAQSVLDKYGADADKPSVHLSRGVITLLDECEAAKAESKALRESLIHACDLQHASQDNERQLRAMRQTANMLSLPFSHDRVQEKYNERERNEALRSQLAAEQRERDAAEMRRLDALVVELRKQRDALTSAPSEDF